MTRRLVRVDTGHLVLAWCVACPSWRELCPDKAAARRAGAAHLAAVHEDAKGGRDERELAARMTRRHADRR